MNIVTILYPKTDDSHFDMDYYTASHMPLFANALGDNCQSWGAAAAKGDDYHCIAWAAFEDMDRFNASMAEHGKEIMGDVGNYTNVAPQMVFGDLAAQG